MRHFANPAFWKCYHRLPKEIQEQADKAFAILKQNPHHPSFRLQRKGPVWAARVTRGYRALAKERPEGFVWFWIGPHDEYVRQLNG